MKLYITRHAETEENIKGIIQGHLPGRLSEEGTRQAIKVAQKLSTEIFQNIYSSDLQRSTETTKEIIKFHKTTPVKYLEILRERNLGEFQGKSREETGWNGSDENPRILNPANGESVDQLYKRAEFVLDTMISAHPDDKVLLITHGGLGKAMISIIEGLGLKGYTTLPGLENTGISIYEIKEDGSGKRIDFNNTDHLN